MRETIRKHFYAWVSLEIDLINEHATFKIHPSYTSGLSHRVEKWRDFNHVLATCAREEDLCLDELVKELQVDCRALERELIRSSVAYTKDSDTLSQRLGQTLNGLHGLCLDCVLAGVLVTPFSDREFRCSHYNLLMTQDAMEYLCGPEREDEDSEINHEA